MSIRSLFVAATLGLALVAPLTSSADPNTPVTTTCALGEYKVVSVTPYSTQERLGKSTVTRLRGADVYIQAEPGLTAEWLRLKLAQHFAATRGSSATAECALNVDGVRVDVDSAGAGFSVKIIALDTGKAEEVLRRARLLVR